MTEQNKTPSVFDTLNAVDVSEKVEKKNRFSYLSWAWAWGELKKRYPDANYFIYERQTEYGPVNYFTDGRTCWVKTEVTVNNVSHVDMLPVLDFKNNPVPLERVTSYDVNKAIQRSITKAIARHGLGLYVYAGEDLPEEPSAEAAPPKKKTARATKKTAAKSAVAPAPVAAPAASAEPVPESVSNTILLAQLAADFAHMKGRGVDDVLTALNRTPTMAGFGVEPSDTSYSPEAEVAAIGVLRSWISRTEN